LRPLPFAQASFAGVFCEHVVEHFSYGEGVKLAAEVCRILRPGGCFRVVVPDAKLILRRYVDAPDELTVRRWEGGDTAMQVVNAYFGQRHEHQFLYDWPTMHKMPHSAGFVQVVRASFGGSTFSKPLLLDDEKYQWESLCVEARKC
jgi:predicted SAM-dependent methyltransferase